MSYPPSAPGGAYPSEGPSHPSFEAPTQSYPAAGPGSPNPAGPPPAATQPLPPTGPSQSTTRPLPPTGGTMPGYPVPGAPTAPVSGPGYPTAPVSVAGYPPVSGAGYPPVSGTGYPGAPVMAPTSAMPTLDAPSGTAARRRPVVPVLAALSALFFLATAVLTGLYLSKSSDYTRTKAKVAAQQKTISDQNTKIDNLNSDLQSTKDQLTKTQQDLTGTKNTADELQHEKDVISNCLNLLGEAGAAAERGDRTTYNAKMKEADKVCDEADKYLN
ncbi:MAG TPA: hypothetical protein VF054_17665 [Micromonosporaceae bacterium]